MQGGVRELGSHDELIAKGGQYHALYVMQHGQAAAEDARAPASIFGDVVPAGEEEVEQIRGRGGGGGAA